MMRLNRQATSIIEYSLFIALLLGALFVCRDLLGRAFMGRWRAVGDSFAFGRQYDPERTLDCAYDAELNKWYDQGCFDKARLQCKIGDFECEKDKISTQCALKACEEF